MKKVIAIVLAAVLVVGGVGSFAYANSSLHDEAMTGQKLVGSGAYCSFPLEVNGTRDFIGSSFAITNPDCVSQITIDRVSIFDTWGELIYEGDLLPLSDGTPQSGLMKPHETRGIQLAEYIPEDYTTVSEAELTFTVEIFWTRSDEEGLPLTGWVTSHIVKRDAMTGELIEIKLGGTTQMVNMEQKLKPKAPAPAAYKYKWRLNYVMPSYDSPYGPIVEAFADEVREKTEGRIDITVKLKHGGMDWVLLNEAVMRGEVEMALVPIAPTYDPRLNIAYYTPYLFTSIEEAKAGYAPGGWIYKMVDGLLAGVNIKGLAPLPLGGQSGCTLREVPPSPADPDVDKEMKIRVMPLKACELTYERLGYSAVQIPYPEAYSAIDTGMVDGQMGGPPFQGTQFMDIQGTWIQYNDYVETGWFMVNLDRQASEYWPIVKADDEKYRWEMFDYGLDIIMFSEAELEHIADVIRTDVWPELEPLVGKAIMDICREAVGIPVE